MRFNRRIPQTVGKFNVLTAHREFMDICEHCGGYITKDTWYVKLERGIAHYDCAKREAEKQASLERAQRPRKPPKPNRSQRRTTRENTRRLERIKRQQSWRENQDAFARAVEK